MHIADIVQSAIDYIEERLEESLELVLIADAASMSVPNLYRMFHTMTGHPIKEYIRKRRISEAASLLRHTDYATIEIGFRCGFDTYQAFIKSFKRITGLTPGLYRKAECIYSFEPINLNERVTYFEEREVSERFPSVRVLRLAPQKGIGFLYAAASEDGLEKTALNEFRKRLSKLEVHPSRLFGWNVNLDGSKSFGYQMAAVSESDIHTTEEQDLQPVELTGGLYAVARIPYGTAPHIIAAWNRLLSEWLPLSTFELSEHGLMEEYQLFNGQLTRLKLYLPVKRRQMTETIEIMERPSVKAVSFQAQGDDCVEQADAASLNWIVQNGYRGDRRLQVYMRCSYGIAPGEFYTYEVCIAPPNDFVPSLENGNDMNHLEGGLYACIRTGAYGSLSGVLERIYRWLDTSTVYEPDRERSWYAHYLPIDSTVETMAAESQEQDQVNVMCCVPIQLKK